MSKAVAPPFLESRDPASKTEEKAMDDFIGDLISAILEAICGSILGAIQAKVRRSVGCFMWYAAILFCFGLLLGGLSGYGVNHSSPLGWLIGGVVGGAVGGVILLR